MTIAIPPQTTEATYEFIVPDGERFQFTGFGFSGADAITLQVMTTADTYADYAEGGSTITLSSSNNSRHIAGPFIGQWSKGTTTGSVGMRLKV